MNAENSEHTTEATPLLQGYIAHESSLTSGPVETRQPQTGTRIHTARNPAKHKSKEATPGTYATLSVLLVGAFISQTDQSLVLATYAKVASEFNDLSAGSWLISAYILAQCIAQPLYGRLSEIYGRKACLQTSYILFAIGTLVSGLGRSTGEIIGARAIQGLGGAGMVSMVSIIITDIVPVHQVGMLRSYVNILQTTGRGCGGVVGGYLTESIGWRWAFLIQVPPTILAILLVQWRLHLRHPRQSEAAQTAWTKLKRVDFVGALFLCITIGAFCFILDRAGSGELVLDSPIAIAFMLISGMGLIAFIVSGHYAAEPIFPLQLWRHRAVLTNYATACLQTAMQISLMAAVPLFIQATHKVSTAVVGAALIPAFFGNTIGGLLAGYWVSRTRTHKPITIFGATMGIVCMLLCLFVWQGTGYDSLWRSLVIFPGGFSVGVVSSSAFVALAAGVQPEDVAIAGSGMYLMINIGAIIGVSAGSAIYKTTLMQGLQHSLQGKDDKEEIIRRALEEVSFVQNADESLQRLLVPSFVAAFHSINYLGLIFSTLAVLSAIISPATRLSLPEMEDEENPSTDESTT